MHTSRVEFSSENEVMWSIYVSEGCTLAKIVFARAKRVLQFDEPYFFSAQHSLSHYFNYIDSTL